MPAVFSSRQVGDQLSADRRSEVGHGKVPERAAGAAGAEGHHEVIGIGGQAGEEGIYRVPVAGVDGGRPAAAADRARRGGQAAGIPPGDDDL